MTIAVDLGRKATKTKKKPYELTYVCSILGLQEPDLPILATILRGVGGSPVLRRSLLNHFWIIRISVSDINEHQRVQQGGKLHSGIRVLHRQKTATEPSHQHHCIHSSSIFHMSFTTPRGKPVVHIRGQGCYRFFRA